MSKEFLEIAKDSEDLVPRKLCWAMGWERYYRNERTWTTMISSFLFALITMMITSIFIPEIIYIALTIASAVCIGFSIICFQTRQNHENAKITLQRIQSELGEEE